MLTQGGGECGKRHERRKIGRTLVSTRHLQMEPLAETHGPMLISNDTCMSSFENDRR